ncbi:MAG: pilus assembly protein PilY [Comamonadaceae bacterium]|nr:MAG: pilus assembly protein PilY [Comamonadaceae bacterium]
MPEIDIRLEDDADPATRPKAASANERQLLPWLERPGVAFGIVIAAIVFGAAVIATAGFAKTNSPLVAAVQLSSEPLHALGGDKPAVVLAMAVTETTAGAQYRGEAGVATDASYENTTEYIGYHDSGSCYAYNDKPSEVPAPGLQAADYKRFDRLGAAGSASRSRICADGFSGNFLNWATSSSLDIVRLALSGGDRIIDTSELTVLQRAVLPDSEKGCLWNSVRFPAKRLSAGGAGGARYKGAVPLSMAREAAGRDIWVANALNRVYFGTTRKGTCADTGSYVLGGPRDPADPVPGMLNSDGYFYARVSVCQMAGDSLGDVRDYGLCVRYPRGNFKPAGAIQRYSERVRVAVFGYLAEDEEPSLTGTFRSEGRYGGVLRVPMKYAGGKTFDAGGRENTPSGGNPQAEWAPDTGIYVADPDILPAAAAEAGPAQPKTPGGIMNYLNRLGRGGPVQGRYRRDGPVDELHHEALRYLQGLSPSPAAVLGIPGSGGRPGDGFAAASSWLDPYEGRPADADYACLKSSIAVIGHSSARGSTRLPAFNATANRADLPYWQSVVTAFETGQTLAYVDGAGHEQKTRNPESGDVPGAPSVGRSLLPGAAYWAHTHDIRGRLWTERKDLQRPGLRATSFFVDVNGDVPAGTPTAPRHPFFLAAKYGGFSSRSSSAGEPAYNSWGNPFVREDGTPDRLVWQDALRPGAPRTYHAGLSARDTLLAFERLFNQASSAGLSIAGTALSGRATDGAGNTMAYQASFDTADWSGDVVATRITASGADSTETMAVTSSPVWSAAAQLSLLSSPATSRNIIVGRGGAMTSPVATAFKWTEIDDGLKRQLAVKTTVPGGDALGSDGLGEERLSWLRGDRSREGLELRRRRHLLGDVVNSGVMYAGAAASQAGQGAAYRAFKSLHANRLKTVYAGANDGMLHAFDAMTGKELFAYIPSWMGGRLAALADPGYASRHAAYVDGKSVAAEAQLAFAGEAADWKTVLVSGTGAGGAGVFALDVTEPGAFTPANVLWEFTRADDPDLGFVTGQPQIVKLRTSVAGSPPTYRWFALVAGGVNNHVPDPAFGSAHSATGQPALFMLALDKPPGVAWTAGGRSPNYYKLVVPVDAALAAQTAPGLVNFTATYAAGQELDKVYMGDLHGRIWKLDFAGRSASEWTFALLSAFAVDKSGIRTPRPLFIAQTAQGSQPVSMAPTVLSVQGQDGLRAFRIAFATGKYLEPSDLASLATQSAYMLHDDGSGLADSMSNSAPAISGRGRLEQSSVNTATFTLSTAAFAWGRPMNDGDKTRRAGWYVDFPGPGERAIASGVARSGLWAFQTLVPAVGTAPNCAEPSGSARTYRAEYRTGNGDVEVSRFGAPAGLVLIDLPLAMSKSAVGGTGRRTRVTPYTTWSSGSSGAGAGKILAPETFAGRLSWRQVSNYRDLKNAP